MRSNSSVQQSLLERSNTDRRGVRGSSWRCCVALAACACGLLGCTDTVERSAGSTRGAVAHWRQPPEVDYHSFDPYTLWVRPAREDSRGTALYEVRVLHGDDPDGYGHSMQFSVLASGSSEPPFIKNAQVRWSPEGVTLSLPSGHSLFIPRAAFVGGR